VLVNTPTLGAELLTDGGLENWNTSTDAVSWTEVLGGTTTLERTTDAYSGTYALKVTLDGSANGFGFKQDDTTPIGAWRLGSMFCKSTSGGTVKYTSGGGSLRATVGTIAATYTEYPATWRNTNAPTDAFNINRAGASGGTVFTIDNLSYKAITLASMFCSVNSRLGNFNLIAPPITVLQNATQSGVVVRLDSATNPQNFVIAYCDGAGNVKIEKCVSGTYTTLSTVVAAYGATKYFSAKATGSSISIYYGTTNFGTLIATVTVSDASIVNNTRHGLFSTYSGNQFAGTFSVVPYA
jgi:hypothetical protein